MVSFTRRYLDGEHEGVWAELRALGPIPGCVSEDCAEVAAETMRRVRRHTERLGTAYLDLGLRSRGQLVPPPPTPEECARLDELAAEIGGLPYALDACMRIVGPVWFHGDCEALGLWYDDMERIGRQPVLPDPLEIGSIEFMEMSWQGHKDDYLSELADTCDDEEEGLEEEPFRHIFSPDNIAKANFSGGHYTIALPSRVADPILEGAAQHCATVTLVEYLRHSISWGGLPGWSSTDKAPPEALRALRITPDF
jgi:hypothetical protein